MKLSCKVAQQGITQLKAIDAASATSVTAPLSALPASKSARLPLAAAAMNYTSGRRSFCSINPQSDRQINWPSVRPLSCCDVARLLQGPEACSCYCVHSCAKDEQGSEPVGQIRVGRTTAEQQLLCLLVNGGSSKGGNNACDDQCC